MTRFGDLGEWELSTNYIVQTDVDKLGWRYGSGTAIYTERFIDGRLISASFQDNGIPIFERKERVDDPSFDLVIDGESLYFGWQIEGFESSTDEQGGVVGVLTLRHDRKPVKLKIVTTAAGHGFFRRKIEITNTSADETLGITSVSPLKGVFWCMGDSIKENLRDNTVHPYSVGHYRDFYWGHEGNFGWQDVPLNTRVAYGSRIGRSGHSVPFFILRNNIFGGYFVCHLAWSGNWETMVSSEYSPNTSKVCLRFDVKPVAPAPMRLIAPGETVTAPEVHFGLNHVSFDDAVQSLHSYLRESVMKTVGDGLQPVIYNHWCYQGDEISDEQIRWEIDTAAEVGAELLMVDAGWYGDKGTKWYTTTGDWEHGDRLPDDLFPYFDYARSKGLKVGLWAEIESAGEDSKLAKEHPDWFISRYGHSIERNLDLVKPEVKDYIESTIVRLIEKYNLDMYRLDYNQAPYEGGFNEKDGRLENTSWRHVEAIYEIFDRVGKRFPHVQFENCSSGGGRMDAGIMSKFTTTWVSDWMSMPRTVRILNGMTIALPPEYVNRMAGTSMDICCGNLDTMFHVFVMSHPMVSGLASNKEYLNPDMVATVKKYVGIYKNFIRPWHRNSRVYHHTPVIEGADGVGWAALEYVSEDKTKAVAAVFRLVNASESVYAFKFNGLDPALIYKVTFEPDGCFIKLKGYELMQLGVEIYLDNALTSKLMLLEV